MEIRSIRHISLQQGDGRHLRYALQPHDLTENDPFIILADDKFAHNTFADHPHKGIQTVTYVLEGSLTHYDSQTNGGGRLQQGDFQIMTAGNGIIHNENPDEGEEVRVLQLWVNLSSEHKKVDAMYEDLVQADVPVHPFEGGQVEVYAGEVAGVRSPLHLYTPFLYAVVTMEANSEWQFPIPAGYNTYMYALHGSVAIGNERMQTHDFAHFGTAEQAETIALKAEQASRFVVFAGEPIREPIVAQGPFVMNTQQEIQEAFAAYRNGTFLKGQKY